MCLVGDLVVSVTPQIWMPALPTGCGTSPGRLVPFGPHTSHVKANDRLATLGLVGSGRVANHTPSGAGQHRAGTTEGVHGRQAAIGAHEQHLHVLWAGEQAVRGRADTGEGGWSGQAGVSP